jgi:hypothetical protein
MGFPYSDSRTIIVFFGAKTKNGLLNNDSLQEAGLAKWYGI